MGVEKRLPGGLPLATRGRLNAVFFQGLPTVASARESPRLAKAPWMPSQPRVGFLLASRTTKVRISL